LSSVVAASTEGYAFPTDLDPDQPIDGLAPEAQAAHVRRALQQGYPPDVLGAELAGQDERRTAAH
jgi:hypothetical protein